MHNIDRTTGEMGYEYSNEFTNESSNESYESYELAPELESTFELGNEYAGEYTGESSGEYQGELPGEVFQESTEMELASELLNVSNEQELDRFLGSLIKRAAGAVGRFAKSSAGRAIGGFLKAAAKRALPWAGRALGTALGGPVGGFIGGKLAGAASNLFELELEGLSNEDKEFEIARAYVRFAGDAVRRAARNPRYRYNPRQVVRGSVINSARRYAPGLLRKRRRPGYPQPFGNGANYAGQPNTDAGMDSPDSGTWYKEGNQIIINL